jgi:hypothetical protein
MRIAVAQKIALICKTNFFGTNPCDYFVQKQSRLRSLNNFDISNAYWAQDLLEDQRISLVQCCIQNISAS